ncbi:uncharacterized protein TM35_000023630 [Trypanosoma theileri]|uniref:Uncharacterized protein n=1 Tax=Trypanosoma theileri TaxID=67003 RepID=A0A1X0P7W5_9TRYP|nr:uncharacterized protein TM35_000023630 [Trypanosoma theileri]ORC93037.1 hypothetical protein TM35_000023630 [Trypanosoma theileri]
MNFLDDDSSTYCSTRTPRSLLTSQSPERQAGIHGEQVEPRQAPEHIWQREFPSSKSSYPSTKLSVMEAVNGNDREFHREEKLNGGVNGISSNIGKVVVATETADSSPIIQKDSVVSVEDQLKSPVNGNKDGDVENVPSPTHDDGSETSSIEFVVDETASRLSGSPSPSSIQFVRDPSVVTQRETSVSTKRNSVVMPPPPPPPSSERIGDTNTVNIPVAKEVINDNEKENMIEKYENIEFRKVDSKRSEEKLRASSLDKNSKTFSQEDRLDSKQKRQLSSREGQFTEGSIHTEKEIPYEKKMGKKKKSSGDFENRGFSRQPESAKRRSSQNSSRDSSITREPRKYTKGKHNMTFERIESLGRDTSSHNSTLCHGTNRHKIMVSSHGVPSSPRRGKNAVVSRVHDHSRNNNNNNHHNNNVSKDNGTPIRYQRQTPLPENVTIVSPALERLRRYKYLDTPLRVRQERKQELLSILEDEMEAVREEVRECDRAMEHAMLRNPYERLYHMNNRRDRDERRTRLLHYMKLKEAREDLLAEDEETLTQRRAKRREMARRRNELYERLYQSSPSRENNSRNTSRHSARSVSPSYVVDDSFFLRLYDEALESIEEKRERIRQAELHRQQKEAEEMLHARILSHLELHTSPRRARTPHQMELQAASMKRKLLEDPERLRKFLHTNKLKKEEEELLAWRLSRQGLVDPEKLEAKRQEIEMEECTFHPKTNTSYQIQALSANSEGYRKTTVAFKNRIRKDEENSTSERSGQQRSYSRTQQRACEQLYAKAIKMREKQKLLVEEAQRAKKLACLKSKLKEDHHFRRRVELDPSLAERYMASLVV